MQWISPWYYGNEAVSINQWENVEDIDCAPTDETCFKTGNDLLDYYSFTVRITILKAKKASLKKSKFYLQNSIYLDIGMLFALAFGYRILGFFALLWKAKRKT